MTESQEKSNELINLIEHLPTIKIYLTKEESEKKTLVRVILENATTYGLIGILIGGIVTGYAQWQSNLAERNTQIILESLKESNDYNGLIDSLNKLSLLQKTGLLSSKIDYDKFETSALLWEFSLYKINLILDRILKRTERDFKIIFKTQ
jgi:hypothetical protein